MKKSWFNNFCLALLVFSFSCSACNRKAHHSGPEVSSNKTDSGVIKVRQESEVTPYHDTINKKAEIRHSARDQQRIDSIKAEKTRKKK